MDGRQETLCEEDEDGDRKEILGVKPYRTPAKVHADAEHDRKQHEKELFGIKVERTDIHKLNIINSRHRCKSICYLVRHPRLDRGSMSAVCVYHALLRACDAGVHSSPSCNEGAIRLLGGWGCIAWTDTPALRAPPRLETRGSFENMAGHPSLLAIPCPSFPRTGESNAQAYLPLDPLVQGDCIRQLIR